MRALIDLAYRLRTRAMALVGWRTTGVRVIAVDCAGRVLLVRHRYGSGDWMLPGGGVKRRETPADAAVREVREETGCALANARALPVFENRSEGRRDTVHLFVGEANDVLAPDGFEIAEATRADPDALPANVSPATRRRIDEWRGRRLSDGKW